MSRPLALGFVAGIALVLLLAGTFAAGVAVGDRNAPHDVAPIDVASSRALPIRCPEGPGGHATRRALVQWVQCRDAATVQRLLLDAGALGAHVSVSAKPGGRLLGREFDKHVVAQVFLTAGEASAWDARRTTSMIAAVVGTSPDRVKVLDESLEPLFDGGKAVPSGRSTLPAARPTQLHP